MTRLYDAVCCDESLSIPADVQKQICQQRPLKASGLNGSQVFDFSGLIQVYHILFNLVP